MIHITCNQFRPLLRRRHIFTMAIDTKRSLNCEYNFANNRNKKINRYPCRIRVTGRTRYCTLSREVSLPQRAYCQTALYFYSNWYTWKQLILDKSRSRRCKNVDPALWKSARKIRARSDWKVPKKENIFFNLLPSARYMACAFKVTF